MADNIKEYGIHPYNFEPLAIDHPELLANEEEGNEENFNNILVANGELHNERVGNTNWCTCNNCIVMTTASESLCCREIIKVVQKTPNLGCVLEWRRLQLNCLDMDVIAPAYYAYVDDTHDINEANIHERYRYVAYRQFIRIIFKRLGRRRRTPIPSCVVNKIRQTWPSEEYSGFHYPRFDDV